MPNFKAYCQKCYDKLNRGEQAQWNARKGKYEGELIETKKETKSYFFSCKKCHRPFSVSKSEPIKNGEIVA